MPKSYFDQVLYDFLFSEITENHYRNVHVPEHELIDFRDFIATNCPTASYSYTFDVREDSHFFFMKFISETEFMTFLLYCDESE